MHNILFRSNEARKRAKNLVDNDYYDSDEDTYFDRTGQIEKNREKRRQRALVSYLLLLSFFNICCLQNYKRGTYVRGIINSLKQKPSMLQILGSER